MNQRHYAGRVGVLLALLLVCLIVQPRPAAAISLVRVESTTLSEGELLTFRFDEDVQLTLSGNGTQSLILASGNSILNDSLPVDSDLLSAIQQNGTSLKLQLTVPVFAELRRAGAGNYLLFLKPTGAAGQPVRSQSQQPASTEPDQRQTTPERTKPSYDPELNQQNEDLLNLARLHAMQGHYDQARDAASRISKDSDQYGWGQLVLGEVEEAQGNERVAVAHYEAALKEEQTEAAAATNLALYHQRKGNTDKSQQMWERVLALGDAAVSPFASSTEDGVETDAQIQRDDVERTGTNIKFNSNSPVEFFDSTLLIVVALFLFVGGGVSAGVLVWRNKRGPLRKKKKKEKPVQQEDEDVFWSGDESTDDGLGALATEIERSKQSNGGGGEIDVSEETRKRLVEMHKQSNSVREIAEITGMSQDIIRMALQMEGVTIDV